jgi:hypothetical protein
MTAAQSRTTAARLITAKGQSLTLTRRAAGAYSPSTGAAITETTQTVKGVILPFSSGLRKMGNTNIVQGDVQLLLSALNTTGGVITAPVVDDRVTAGAKIYTLVDVAPLAPDGTDIFYECTLRA